MFGNCHRAIWHYQLLYLIPKGLGLLLREVSPFVAERLLLDQSFEVESLVVLVRLGTWVTEDTPLVQLFRDLLDQPWLRSRDIRRNARPTSRIFFGVICKSLEPDCCISTVVSGNGFLTIQLVTKARPMDLADIPFRRWLGLDAGHCRHGLIHTLLIQRYSSLHIEEMIPPPFKFDSFDIP